MSHIISKSKENKGKRVKNTHLSNLSHYQCKSFSRIIGTYTNIAQSNIDFNVWYKYSRKQPGFVKNENGSVTPTFIGSYSLADAGVSRRFWKSKINVSLGCRNLFDVRNIAAQLAGGAHASGENVTALATGRNFFTKVEIKL